MNLFFVLNGIFPRLITHTQHFPAEVRWEIGCGEMKIDAINNAWASASTKLPNKFN